MPKRPRVVSFNKLAVMIGMGWFFRDFQHNIDPGSTWFVALALGFVIAHALDA